MVQSFDLFLKKYTLGPVNHLKFPFLYGFNIQIEINILQKISNVVFKHISDCF